MTKRTLALVFTLTLLFLFVSPIYAEIKIFFSPNGGATEETIEQIDKAENYIDIAMYSFTSEPIAEAIIRAKERGVKIRILMDKQQAGGKYSKYQYFVDNGIDVIRDIHAGIMHNKVAVIDGNILFTGSFNWTKSAEVRNEENLLQFIDEPEIIEIYQKRVNYLWKFNGGPEDSISAPRT